MGFSWAFHLAHQAHRTLAMRMLPGIQLVEDRTPSPRMKRDDCALLLYADNANHLGTNASLVNMQRAALSEGCARSGLLTHEVVEATTLAESLGVRVDGEQGTIGPTAEREWRLDRALRALCGGARFTPQEFDIVLGHLTVRSLLHRGLLSVLRYSFEYPRRGRAGRHAL